MYVKIEYFNLFFLYHELNFKNIRVKNMAHIKFNRHRRQKSYFMGIINALNTSSEIENGWLVDLGFVSVLGHAATGKSQKKNKKLRMKEIICIIKTI